MLATISTENGTGLLVAVALLVYLVYALVRAEKF
jgi:K+-transporting ATPase KdpF subunit